MTSKVKRQGHKLTSSVRLISASSQFGKQNAVPVSLEAGGAYRVGRTRRPHFLFKKERSVAGGSICIRNTVNKNA